MEHAAEVERKTYRESLQNNREQILLSKKLATIHTDVPVEVELDVAGACARSDADALRELYRTLEFSSLLRDLAPAARSSPAARLPAARVESGTGRVAQDASRRCAARGRRG